MDNIAKENLNHPHDEDYEDNMCPRCQCCEQEWVECPYCNGEGGRGWEDLQEEDPLWYSPRDFVRCDACNGKSGHWECIGNCDKNGKHNVEP